MPLRPGDTAFLDQLARHRRAGATLVMLNASFDQMEWHHGFKMLATFRAWIQRHPQDYVMVESAGDIETAKSSKRLGIAFDLEGGVAVDDLPELVELYYRLGVRWMLIAYNRNNRLGGGCQDRDTGLSEFGRRVIDEMERVGMVLCCSHTGYRTAREAMEYANQPVIFSHSNPRSLLDHERNIPDDLIRACAATGGVINASGIGLFLGDNDSRTETYVRHLQYLADLVGPQHVGIGLDYVYDQQELYDYIKARPDLFPPEKGYPSGQLNLVEPEQIPAIVETLLQTGWSDADIGGVLGGNNLRVARAVWK
jgi:membrane dipeptidase